MVEEEDEEEGAMIQEDAIREDVDEEALVHGEEEAIFQENAIGNENESGEDIGPEEEQIIIPVPVERYPQRI